MSCAINVCVLLDVSEIKMHLQFADSHFKIESQNRNRVSKHGVRSRSEEQKKQFKQTSQTGTHVYMNTMNTQCTSYLHDMYIYIYIYIYIYTYIYMGTAFGQYQDAFGYIPSLRTFTGRHSPAISCPEHLGSMENAVISSQVGCAWPIQERARGRLCLARPGACTR